MATVSHTIEKLTTSSSGITSKQSEYYVSDIFNELGYQSKEEFESTLNNIFDSFYSKHVSIKQNFKQVFKFNSGIMYTDWKISSLAYDFIKRNKKVLNNKLSK